MNREIKFRAWAGGKMWYQGSFEFQQVGETVMGSRSKFILWEFDGIESGENLFAPIDLDSEKPQVMQFTGLKDKDSKEIYEGDIIESLWVVRWHDGHFVLDDRGAKEEFCAAMVRNDAIIGNIFENPELLKD